MGAAAKYGRDPAWHAPRAATEEDVAIGTRLRAVRHLRRMSQAALGQGAGVSVQQVQKYEVGQNKISGSRLYRFAELLGVPINCFFGEAPLPQAKAPASAFLPLSERRFGWALEWATVLSGISKFGLRPVSFFGGRFYQAAIIGVIAESGGILEHVPFALDSDTKAVFGAERREFEATVGQLADMGYLDHAGHSAFGKDRIGLRINRSVRDSAAAAGLIDSDHDDQEAA